MKQTIIAYLAGVLDSDGSIGIRKDTYGMRVRLDQSIPNYVPRLSVSQTTPEAIALFKRAFGGMIYVVAPQGADRMPVLRWEIRHARAARAIAALLPHLRIKRAQAKVLLRLQAMKDAPQKGVHNVEALSRWGTTAVFKRRMRTAKQLSNMESEYLKMRSLNDTRCDPQFWPITDRQRTQLLNNKHIRNNAKLDLARKLLGDYGKGMHRNSGKTK